MFRHCDKIFVSCNNSEEAFCLCFPVLFPLFYILLYPEYKEATGFKQLNGFFNSCFLFCFIFLTNYIFKGVEWDDHPIKVTETFATFFTCIVIAVTVKTLTDFNVKTKE